MGLALYCATVRELARVLAERLVQLDAFAQCPTCHDAALRGAIRAATESRQVGLGGLVAADQRSAFHPAVTVEHLAIGFATARVQARGRRDLIRQLLLFGTLSVLPDLDLVAAALHHSRAVLGHRGVTHSLMFAAVVAILVVIVGSKLSPGSSRTRTGIVAFLVVASHAVLDPLCAGSSGTRLLWPFTTARITWGSFQPFPDALSGSKWPYLNFHHLAVEFLISSPLLLYALWPRGTRRVERVEPVARVFSAAAEPVPVEVAVEKV